MILSRGTLRHFLTATPIAAALRPAWFDEARLLIQGPCFERIAQRAPFVGRVLNAGCGEGLYTPFLEKFSSVVEIVNVDLTRPTIATLRQDPRHRDLAGSLTNLPFEDGAFDACLCSEVLEHIEDDQLAVSELARCLRPGGWLLISVPTPPAPFDPNHAREGYRLDELRELLERNGFSLKAHAYCFHAVSRILYLLWEAQLRRTGRNLFPRILLRSLAHLDRVTRLGRPWDLVVLAARLETR